MQLGGCENEKDIPCVSRYFCSKHFDESKYVASNPRRKQLLSTAIPYPCMESAQLVHDESDISITVDETDYQCEVSSGHAIDEQDLNEVTSFTVADVTEDVSNDINCVSESVESFENLYEEYPTVIDCPDIEEDNDMNKKTLKRKLNHFNDANPKQAVNTAREEASNRTVTIICNRPTSTMDINRPKRQQVEDKSNTNEEFDATKLDDETNITTFIFKGEEYVQMPKERYVNEKMLLLNKIRSYEETLKNIKHLMDNVRI